MYKRQVDVQGLAFPLRAWGRLLGIEELSLRASSINNTVALLDVGADRRIAQDLHAGGIFLHEYYRCALMNRDAASAGSLPPATQSNSRRRGLHGPHGCRAHRRVTALPNGSSGPVIASSR